MGASAIPAAIAARNWEDMRAAFVSELVPVIPAATDPQTWDPRELGVAGGNVWKAVIWQEVIWHRDPDDSTTDHDELTCIVTLDGSRYKTNDVRFPESVLSRTITEPPISGVEYGDTFLVPEGGTEDWAGKDGYRAMFTARGWKFRPPSVGELVYVADPVDLGFIHVNDQGEWEDGVGPRNLIDGSVLPRHLLIRSWQVENQTTTAPPSEGPAGEQYIVGPAATGAWAGHDKKIAWRPATGAAFVITTPFVGEVVFDKNLNIPIRWNGTAWESAAGAIIFHDYKFENGTTGFTLSGSGFYTYSPTTAPTTSNQHVIESLQFTHTAKRVGAKIIVTYIADVVVSAGAPVATGLWIDAQSASVRWTRGGPGAGAQFSDHQQNFVAVIEATDTLSHTYRIKIMTSSGADLTFSKRLLQIEEFA